MKYFKPTLFIIFAVFLNFGATRPKPEKAILINLINNLRKDGCDCGKQQFKPVPSLSKNDFLTKSAQRHLNDMLQNQVFNHVGSDNSSMAKRISDSGYQWVSIAENIATNQTSEPKVLEFWRQQNGDCKNLLNPKFKDIGVAHAEGVWVICLASPLK